MPCLFSLTQGYLSVGGHRDPTTQGHRQLQTWTECMGQGQKDPESTVSSKEGVTHTTERQKKVKQGIMEEKPGLNPETRVDICQMHQ